MWTIVGGPYNNVFTRSKSRTQAVIPEGPGFTPEGVRLSGVRRRFAVKKDDKVYLSEDLAVLDRVVEEITDKPVELKPKKKKKTKIPEPVEEDEQDFKDFLEFLQSL